jgi:hypothetical protein
MFISANEKSISVNASKFRHKRFRKLLVASVIKHDLLFRYVEYDGVRETMQYLRSDLSIISRNTAKADLIKMHLIEKQRIKYIFDILSGEDLFNI